jgi:hypothetical protein
MGYDDLLESMEERILIIKRAALQLKQISGGIQAVDCNVDRILSSVRMLEINVTDAIEGKPV